MSAQIDWSKAPEWAKKHGRTALAKSRVWFDDEKYTYADEQRGGKVFFYADACTYAHDDFVDITERPTTPSWSGEGLPPIGVDCEYMKRGGAEWFHCTVIAEHDGGVVVAVHEDDLSYTYWNDTGHFRPIRTPEQIAADEREAVVKQMIQACPYKGSECTRIDCEALYDAGYRLTKQDGE